MNMKQLSNQILDQIWNGTLDHMTGTIHNEITKQLSYRISNQIWKGIAVQLGNQIRDQIKLK